MTGIAKLYTYATTIGGLVVNGGRVTGVRGIDVAVCDQRSVVLSQVSIKQNQHANRDGDGVGPWTKLMIFVNGAGKARIGERVVDVKAGERLFVPPQVINEFWNDAATPLEGVLIIFGDGA